MDMWLASVFSEYIFPSLLALIGLAGGIIITLFTFVRGKKEKLPICRMDTIPLMTNHLISHGSLKILWNNDAIPNVSITKIHFSNQGKEAIRRADISSGNPLRVEMAEGYYILDYQLHLLSMNDNGVKIKLSQDRTILEISFAYLDEKDEFLVFLYHTGTLDKDLTLKGKIIGVSQLTKVGADRETRNRERRLRYLRGLYLFAIIVLSMCIGLVEFAEYWLSINSNQDKIFGMNVLWFVWGMMCFQFFLFFIFSRPILRYNDFMVKKLRFRARK